MLCSKMPDMEIRRYEPRDEESVVRLWTDCGLVVPWNNPRRDIERKLKVQEDMFLIACLDGRVVATVMVGYDGHRGWINYLAVSPLHRRAGIGRRMMPLVIVKLYPGRSEQQKIWERSPLNFRRKRV